MDPWSTEHRWSLLCAAAYAGLVVVLGLASLVLGDRWWNHLANLTAFWLLVPSLPLLILALAFRRLGAATLLLVPLVLLLWGYAGLFVGRAPADEELPEDRLTVAAYNLWYRSTSVDHVEDLVRDVDPDLLLVAEATEEHADDLQEVLAGTLPHSWFGPPRRFGGVGVLSRHPIDEVRPIPGAGEFERPTAIVVVDVPRGGGTQSVQAVPVHLMARCPVCRPFVAGQQREVASRRGEVGAIVEALRSDQPAVVAGDYNSTRWTEPYRMLVREGFTDPHRAVGFGLGFTFPGDHETPGVSAGGPAPLAHLPLVSVPVLRLDQVLVRGLEPLRSDVGDARASDHRPVVVDLGW